MFHSLEGKKICFKPLSLRDAKEIHSFTSDEEVARFIGWPLMNTMEETCEHIGTMLKNEAAGTHLYASIALKENSRIIGTAMIFSLNRKAGHAEIGYVLHQDYWGRGYGTEMVALIDRYAFEVLKLHKLYARVVHANIPSARVLENNDYELEGRLKDHYFIENQYYDALLFGKIHAE